VLLNLSTDLHPFAFQDISVHNDTYDLLCEFNLGGFSSSGEELFLIVNTSRKTGCYVEIAIPA
jgi:hypothetical protein